MSDFDYIKEDAALSRIPLDPPEYDEDEGCRAWNHRNGCDCPTLADLEAMAGDDYNKSLKEW